MRHPHRHVRVLVVTAAVTACLATTGAAAFAASQPSHVQSGNSQSANSQTRSASGDEKQNVAVVQSALQVVFNEHRVDQVDRYFTKDFVQHSPLVTPDLAGRDGLKRWLTGIVTAIPDLTYSADQPIADGDRVMVFADVTGTIEGDLPAYGIKGSGQPLKVSTAQVFRVAQGKIAEHWEVVDTGPLLQLALASSAP
jgi:predicted SnoaL-like aldol condensation-catalyzing enzyme